MNEKIKMQLESIELQMAQAGEDYRNIMTSLSEEQSKLMQAILYTTPIPAEIQFIIDESEKP